MYFVDVLHKRKWTEWVASFLGLFLIMRMRAFMSFSQMRSPEPVCVSHLVLPFYDGTKSCNSSPINSRNTVQHVLSCKQIDQDKSCKILSYRHLSESSKSNAVQHVLFWNAWADWDLPWIYRTKMSSWHYIKLVFPKGWRYVEPRLSIFVTELPSVTWAHCQQIGRIRWCLLV